MKTFQDKELKIRIKSENTPKSGAPVRPPPQPPIFASQSAPFPSQSIPYPFLVMSNAMQSGATGLSLLPGQASPSLMNAPLSGVYPSPVGQVRGGGEYDAQGDAYQYSGENQRGRTKRGSQNGPRTAAPGPKIGPTDFPPLPDASQLGIGYDRPFKKYTKQESVAVLLTLQNLDVPVPEGLPLDCFAVSEEMIRDIELIREPPSAPAAPVEEEQKQPEQKPSRSSKRGDRRTGSFGRGSRSRNSRNSRPEE
eukprot:NODE_1212_length_1233_cov_42.942568_g988_i0.p1 GENE.NODE_1212_length_1233_cov_42.942568_g988_i0~~NODE_1212_length_1233_cov_42.942568_g988_i0.p1  ORF type:complete len:251 (+),score=41.52 NODE_1212_length_1233_cov_42.942568_g988_i0:99-851(+)